MTYIQFIVLFLYLALQSIFICIAFKDIRMVFLEYRQQSLAEHNAIMESIKSADKSAN